jgi:hypothetical protein
MALTITAEKIPKVRIFSPELAGFPDGLPLRPAAISRAQRSVNESAIVWIGSKQQIHSTGAENRRVLLSIVFALLVCAVLATCPISYPRKRTKHLHGVQGRDGARHMRRKAPIALWGSSTGNELMFFRLPGGPLLKDAKVVDLQASFKSYLAQVADMIKNPRHVPGKACSRCTLWVRLSPAYCPGFGVDLLRWTPR